MKRTNNDSKILAEVKRAVKETTDMVSRNELEPYFEKERSGAIRVKGDMVDESEEITPQQVAILGAHMMAYNLYESIKEDKEEFDTVVVEVKDGKSREISKKDLPPEVLKAIKKFLEEDK